MVCDFLKQTVDMFINYVKTLINKVTVWTTAKLAKHVYVMYIKVS